MKKTIFLIIIIIIIALVSCQDSFLDTKPLTSKTNSNYYQTPSDMDMALTAIYTELVKVPDDGWVVVNYPFAIAELMSDDRFGGGGDNDRNVRAVADFKITDPNMYDQIWQRCYQGIFRSNMLLENIDIPQWESDNQKGKVAGQAHFLRAMFYFDMARLFGKIPLVLKSEPDNLPQAEPAELYAQISTDLKTAIETFPATQYGEAVYSDLGRANKWTAQALMARVFLFYTGYYNTDVLPLVDGGSVSKNDVVAYVNDCVINSGYDLMPDFRNLWPYAIANSTHSEEPYKYAEDNNLEWYGEEGANKESMFALKFSTFADWGTSIFYSNQMDLFFGWRTYSYKGAFGEGWGVGTVNENLWDEWPDNDIRKKGSIINVQDPNEGVENYDYGTDFHDKQMEETGLWQKKYRPVNLKNSDGDPDGIANWHNYSVSLYGATKNFQLDNLQDIILIRFSDVLLMQSELTQTVEGINKVRDRVGLEQIGSYTLDALKKERHHELAFEGIRYYDLLRWAGKDNLEEVKTILEHQNGVSVINNGVIGEKNGVLFRPETGGFLQIPNREIQLSDGVLEQNPGWGANAPIY